MVGLNPDMTLQLLSVFADSFSMWCVFFTLLFLKIFGIWFFCPYALLPTYTFLAASWFPAYPLTAASGEVLSPTYFLDNSQ